MATKEPQHADERSRFVRSINAEHDHRNDDAISGYLLTAGARRVLRRLAQARTEANAAKVYTLTGPYGTGKSAFCVFAAQILAPPSFVGHGRARAVLRAGDADLHEDVFSSHKASRGLWPIVVTGSREPLHVALLRGLRSSVANLGPKADASLLRHIAKALNQAVSGQPVTDREIVELFSLSIHHVCDKARAAAGVFLLIDEMGKLLEFAASQPGESDLYVLQQLAEFASRSEATFLFMGVLHQDFAGYAGRLSSVERAEWDKIRGRFEDIVFEEPADEMLRLVAKARDCQLPDTSLQLKWFADLCRRAGKLNLVLPGLAKVEFRELLARCWPLHPMVSLLLGHIFRKLAQNERSAFSFLTSSEPYGLAEFLEQRSSTGSSPYALYHLYDYLVHALGDGLYMQRNGKRWAEIESILDRLPDAGATAIAVLKTIGLLNAVGEWRRIIASREFVEFAMQGSATPAETAEAISFLQSHSALTVRSFNDTYALWQGSDIDIDERVREARNRMPATVTTASLAHRYLSPKPLVARRHSFDTGTLRYFSVRFANVGGLADLAAAFPQNADGRVVLVIPENAQDLQQAWELVVSERIARCDDLLLGVPANPKALDGAVRELACLDWVKDNTPQLEGDATARRELRARMADVQRQLDALVSDMLAPSPASRVRCRWFHRGAEVALASRRQLNERLSSICSELYGNAPVILNELLNRRELSSQAAAARRNLIEAMLDHPDKEALGIEGTPPEKSMYLSVLDKFGLHRQVDGGWRLAAPPPRADEGIRAVWTAIQSFFDSCDRSGKPISDLFAALNQRPYGVREGPIPVLVCVALVVSDADVAIYEDGSFVPQLTVPIFERLMKAPSQYVVRRWRVTGVRATVFHQLAEMLGKDSAMASLGKRNVLDAVRPLMKFAGSLSDYAKHTSRLGQVALKIRACLLQAREPDQLLFTDLPQACGFHEFPAEGKHHPEEVRGFLEQLRTGIGELQRAYDELVTEIHQAVANAFGVAGTVSDCRKAIAARAEGLRSIASDALLRAFIVRCCDGSMHDQGWVESIAALLAERPPAGWRDADRARFELSLAKVARLFAHLEPLAFSQGDGRSTDGEEAIRIGITSRDAAEQERVVRVPASARSQVQQLERAIEQAMGGFNGNGRTELAIAALARLARKLLT